MTEKQKRIFAKWYLVGYPIFIWGCIRLLRWFHALISLIITVNRGERIVRTHHSFTFIGPVELNYATLVPVYLVLLIGAFALIGGGFLIFTKGKSYRFVKVEDEEMRNNDGD